MPAAVAGDPQLRIELRQVANRPELNTAHARLLLRDHPPFFAVRDGYPPALATHGLRPARAIVEAAPAMEVLLAIVLWQYASAMDESTGWGDCQSGGNHADMMCTAPNSRVGQEEAR